MSLLSLIAALLLEQFNPLPVRNSLMAWYSRYANMLERELNAGHFRHGVLAWVIAAVLPCLLVWGIYHLLYALSPVFAWAWNVLVLYLMIGFRHFSHAFSGIAEALQAGDLVLARKLLADWTLQNTDEMESEEIAKLAIEQGLIDSYRYVFGTIFWFLLLPGPTGAVLYRFASRLAVKWGEQAPNDREAFGLFAARALKAMDWVPIRLTSISFAVVGDFEDAVYCWRSQAQTWINYDYGVLLASGAGAIGIRLGESLHQDNTVKYRPELGIGDAADADYLASAVGLVWRTVVLWLVLALMFSLTHWVGG
ncbi:MAG: adenosylcobinamide-phosphate synthase [Pseudomonadota bacterium]|nr:adenosylcobinamide-phosphate synthase [Pseudomonadota bacterium]